MKQRILIAVPTLGQTVHVTLAHTLAHAERLSMDADCPWSFTKCFFVGYQPVDWMRNSIFRALLESDCERVWMLDDDIIPPPNAFDMLERDEDVVVGAMPGYKPAADGGIALQLLAYERKGEQWNSLPVDTPSGPVDGGGAGCMVIHRRVLEDRRMRLEPDPDGEKPERWAPSIYRVQHEPWGSLKNTGDLDFCGRAVDLGYTVGLWADGMFGQRETLDLRDVALYGANCARKAEKVAV